MKIPFNKPYKTSNEICECANCRYDKEVWGIYPSLSCVGKFKPQTAEKNQIQSVSPEITKNDALRGSETSTLSDVLMIGTPGCSVRDMELQNIKQTNKKILERIKNDKKDFEARADKSTAEIVNAQLQGVLLGLEFAEEIFKSEMGQELVE